MLVKRIVSLSSYSLIKFAPSAKRTVFSEPYQKKYGQAKKERIIRTTFIAQALKVGEGELKAVKITGHWFTPILPNLCSFDMGIRGLQDLRQNIRMGQRAHFVFSPLAP